MSDTERPPPTNDNVIKAFMHCALCLQELPPGTSPRDYARIEVGWTEVGFQAWCVRHEANILHVDFEGQKHAANTTARKPGARPPNPRDRRGRRRLH